MFPFSAEHYNPENDSLTDYNFFFKKIYPLFFKRIGEINILLAWSHEHAHTNARTPVEPSGSLGVCFLRLSPPTPGLARRGRRTGAQLDGNSLCTPLAADFGPGPEGRRGRAQLDWEFALYACHPYVRPTWPVACASSHVASQMLRISSTWLWRTVTSSPTRVTSAELERPRALWINQIFC